MPERLFRLDPPFLCYHPPDADTAPAAAGEGNAAREPDRAPTFASFNNVSKITPGVVAAWSRLLDRASGSRLLIKAAGLHDAWVRDRLAGLFAGHGIGPDRVELLGQVASRAEHLALYGRADVALDTFPYNGTATTCEALWMGVPVVTLEGATHAGRVGVSLLTVAGLTDLIARDEDEYVRIASELGKNRVRLQALRGSLRETVARSSLCDGAGFTRRLEAAYRQMWTGWCAREGSPR